MVDYTIILWSTLEDSDSICRNATIFTNYNIWLISCQHNILIVNHCSLSLKLWNISSLNIQLLYFIVFFFYFSNSIFQARTSWISPSTWRSRNPRFQPRWTFLQRWHIPLLRNDILVASFHDTFKQNSFKNYVTLR